MKDKGDRAETELLEMWRQELRRAVWSLESLALRKHRRTLRLPPPNTCIFRQRLSRLGHFIAAA